MESLILITVGALETVTKGLEQKKLVELEIRGRIETFQTTSVLISAKILRCDLGT